MNVQHVKQGSSTFRFTLEPYWIRVVTHCNGQFMVLALAVEHLRHLRFFKTRCDVGAEVSTVTQYPMCILQASFTESKTLSLGLVLSTSKTLQGFVFGGHAVEWEKKCTNRENQRINPMVGVTSTFVAILCMILALHVEDRKLS